MQARKHSGKAYDLAEKLNLSESDILDFSSNLNPLGTPFKYMGCYTDPEKLVLASSDKFAQYPDNRYLELRAAAASFAGKGLSLENIIPANGSCEILRLAIQSVVNEEDLIIIPSPSSGQYRHLSEVFGARVHSFTTKELLTLPKMTLDRAKIVIIQNPNDPTGELVSHKSLEEFANRCAEHNTLLIVDESYIELADPQMSVADLTINNNYLLVIRSISNIIAMPGLRLAYGGPTRKNDKGF
ncbi:MAG: aminotransferase class I/II-fold pyridoxal phosphate-dependent enzyme [Methanolobus sp.]